MRSIFNHADRDTVLQRIERLSAESTAQWGSMSVSQMLSHCIKCEEYYMGVFPVKRSFLGRLIGGMALKGILKNDQQQLGRNAPTQTGFKVAGAGVEITAGKERWQQLISAYAQYSSSRFNHWFFGKMTREQLGQFIFKHCDHHLRQFGV